MGLKRDHPWRHARKAGIFSKNSFSKFPFCKLKKFPLSDEQLFKYCMPPFTVLDSTKLSKTILAIETMILHCFNFRRMKIGLIPFILTVATFAVHPATARDKTRTDDDFENRLEHYLNLETRDFIAEMTVREKLLLQMIQNITSELNLRQHDVNDRRLSLLDTRRKAGYLLDEYSRELNRIVQLSHEIDPLKKRAEASGNLSSWKRLRSLHEQLISTVDDENLQRERLSTNSRISLLLKEQNAEVNTLVRMYEKLESLQKLAEARNNQSFLGQIQALQDSIRIALGDVDSSKSQFIANAYFEEAESLVATLRELDELQSRALAVAPEVSVDIQDVRRTILQKLPRRLPLLLGYNYVILEESRIPQLVNEWKANQVTDYAVRLMRYRIIEESLLDNATPTQYRRMRARSLYDAYRNYALEEYELAKMQFDRVLQIYGSNFEDAPALYFDRGESLFAQKLYNDAEQDYLVLVSEYPDSKYLGLSFFRLLQMHERKPNRGNFYRFFSLMQSNRNRIDSQSLDKCFYLAGYVQLKDGDFSAAENSLNAVSPEFEQYWKSRLLLGVARTSQQKYAEVIDLFAEITETVPSGSFIRDSGHLRLGYLYYERGEFEQALQHFERVSPTFANHAETLLSIAWTHLKLKNYDKTVDTIELLTKYYLDSEHIYEAQVLAAHARRLLDDTGGSQQHLRYVANARSALELSSRYNAERELVLDQLNTLDHLEKQALEQNDRGAFQVVDFYRTRLQDALQQFELHGARGNFALENLETERTKILSQIEQLERLMAKAGESDDEEAFKVAQRQHERLVKALQLYDSDTASRRRSFFVDYPLATKEAVQRYRKEMLQELSTDLSQEQAQLNNVMTQVAMLQKEIGQNHTAVNADMQLEVLNSEVFNLYERMQRLQAWTHENTATEVKTDFNRYADFSGFGMSDATFAAIQQKDKVLAKLSDYKNAIANLVIERKEYLRDRVRAHEAELRRLEKERQQERLEQEREERREYLQESYFDTTDREIPESESTEEESESSEESQIQQQNSER